MRPIFKLIGLILPHALAIGVPLVFAGWLLFLAMHAGPDAQAQTQAMVAHAYSNR